MGRLVSKCVRGSSPAAAYTLRAAIKLVLIGLLSATAQSARMWHVGRRRRISTGENRLKARRSLSVCCATLAAVATLPAVSPAVVYNWDGSSGAQFSNSANWTPAGVPGSNDTATFRLGNGVSVPVLLLGPMFEPYNATVDRLIIGTNTVTMGGGTMTVDGTNVITETEPGLVIGETATDVAVFNMNAPNLSTLYATLGSTAGSSGTLNLISTAGALNVTGTGVLNNLIVGRNGTGTINVSNGRDVTVADETVLGLNATGVGNVSISGAGSTWTSSGDLTVGAAGSASLTVSANATLQ